MTPAPCGSFPVGAILAVVAAATLSAEPASGDRLAELPRPSLALVDADVAGQLEARRREVEELFASDSATTGERAAAIGSLGGLYYLYDYVDLARWCFEEAERLAPDDPRWPYLGALAARLEGDLAAAEEALVRALARAPDDATIHVRLGDVRLDRGRPEDAEASYRAALGLDEARPAAHYGLGRIAASRGLHSQAIERFERALELQPEATSLHHQIGMAHRALGDREAARRELALNTGGRVRVVDPVVDSLGREIQSASRWFSAGAQAMRRGDHDEAIELFVRAREERPDDHLVEYNLGLAYLRTDRRAEAVSAFERSIEKNPDFRNGHYNLAQLLAEDGRLEEAERSFRRAHEIDPEDQEAHLEWATTLAQLGQGERAEKELAALVGRAPQLTTAFLRLGQLQLARGAGAEARASFHRVLDGDASDEESAAAHLGLGGLADQVRDPAAALDHYQRAAALDSSPGTRLAVAGALGRLGRFEEAAEAFSSVIADGAAPLEAHVGRAMAFLLARADPQARRALEESLAGRSDDLVLRHLYARVLATSNDPAVRDGARALEVARQVFTSQQTLGHAETVAMALAEAGDFAAAVDWQRRVVAEAERAGQSGPLAGARRRLAAYERGEPCRAPWLGG